jgi:hypothetical protein
VAEKTEGFAHRHLEKLVKTALQRTISTDANVPVTMDDYLQAITTIKESDTRLNGKKSWNKRAKKAAKWLLGGAAIAIPLAVQYWLNQKNLDAQAQAFAEQKKTQKISSDKQDEYQKKTLEAQEENTWLAAAAFCLQLGVAILQGAAYIGNLAAKHRDPYIERTY